MSSRAAPPPATTQGPASPPPAPTTVPPATTAPPVPTTAARPSTAGPTTYPVVPTTAAPTPTSRPPTTPTTPTTTSLPPSSTTISRYTSSTTPRRTSSTTSSRVTTSTTSSKYAVSPTSQPPYQSVTPQPPPQTPAAQPSTTINNVVTITADKVTQSSGAPPITSTLTSVFSSEVISTEADGLIVTTTLQSTIIIVPTTITSSKSSNTGAIAGGVAGGIAVLASAIIIFLFYWRRNRRREEFDGNFDPNRVIRHAGHTDLVGAEVTPYHYEAPSTALSGPTSPTFTADGSMRQYRDSQALLGSTFEGAAGGTGTSGSHYAPTSSDGASAPPGSSSHERSMSHGSGPGLPVAQPYHPMSSKEREALRQRGEGRIGLASPIEEGEADVIQHSDGGRVTEEPVSPSRPVQEIPPSYDSISGPS